MMLFAWVFDEVFICVFSGVAVGSGWQAFVAYVNIGSYYFIGVPLGVFLGWVFHLGVLVCFICYDYGNKSRSSIYWFFYILMLQKKVINKWSRFKVVIENSLWPPTHLKRQHLQDPQGEEGCVEDLVYREWMKIYPICWVLTIGFSCDQGKKHFVK